MTMGLGSFILGSAIIMSFFGILSVLAFVFWVLMLVDSIKRKFKKNDDKTIWVIVIVLTGTIGALIYYFVVKRKNKK